MSYENMLIREATGEYQRGDTTCSDCNQIICACESFSEWLNERDDSLPLPESFTQWLELTQDAIDPESLDYSRGVKIVRDEDGKLHFRPERE